MALFDGEVHQLVFMFILFKKKRWKFSTFTGIENLPFERIYLSTGPDAICWSKQKKDPIF